MSIIVDNGTKHRITCNIGDYPNGRPLWFSDSENDLVVKVYIRTVFGLLIDLKVLQNVDTEVRTNDLRKMVKFIHDRLCEFFNQSVS